jgi:hypothetical protein
MNFKPLESFTQSMFSEAVGTVFRVQTNPEVTTGLRLMEVTPGLSTTANDREAARYESFSLVFQGPGEQFLPQRMYAFDHDHLGRFELFIVPVGKEGGGFKYQAVFNRRVPSAN